MDLKRWKIFQKLDPNFVSDVKRAYLVGRHPGEDLTGKKGGPRKQTWKGCLVVMRDDEVYFFLSRSTSLYLLPIDELDQIESALPFVPVKIEGLSGQNIQAVSSGYGHVTVLTRDGRVYQWGQVLPDRESHKVRLVSGHLENKRVVQVACGLAYTLALTQEGQVYAWGNNTWGQLGIGSHSLAEAPAL